MHIEARTPALSAFPGCDLRFWAYGIVRERWGAQAWPLVVTWNTRREWVTRMRAELVYRLRTDTRIPVQPSYPEIARAIGARSHSSAHAAHKRFERMLADAVCDSDIHTAAHRNCQWPASRRLGA